MSCREKAEPGTAAGAESGDANRLRPERAAGRPCAGIVAFGAALPAASARRRPHRRCDPEASRSRSAARLQPAVRADTQATRLRQDPQLAGLLRLAPELAAARQAAPAGTRPRAIGSQKWPRKIEQHDKWLTCSPSAMMIAAEGAKHESQTTSQSLTGLQGQGGAGCRQGREAAGGAGRAV